jgi:hypothetical protein
MELSLLSQCRGKGTGTSLTPRRLTTITIFSAIAVGVCTTFLAAGCGLSHICRRASVCLVTK